MILASFLLQLQIYISSLAEGLLYLLGARGLLFISVSSTLPEAQGSAHIMANVQRKCVNLDEPLMQLPSLLSTRRKNFTRYYFAKNIPLRGILYLVICNSSSPKLEVLKEIIIKMMLFNT